MEHPENIWILFFLLAAASGVFSQRIRRFGSRRVQGQDRWAAFRASAGNDKPFSVLGAVRSLFAERSPGSLSESRQFSRNIIDASALGIIAYRADGQCRLANTAAATILETSIEDLRQQNFHQSILWRETGVVEKARAVLGNDTHPRSEAYIRIPSGRRIWIRYSCACFQSRGADHFLIIFEDITRRKQMEERLARKNRDMETLLYITSHDLREPLRSIQNFSKLVHDRYADRLDEKGQDFLNRVVTGGRRLEELIDDILHLSRAQRMICPDETVNGRLIVEDAVKKLEPRIAESGTILKIDDPFDELRVHRTWAAQAVYNLLANAIKFTKTGCCPEIEIAPFVSDENPRKGIVVKDRGIGINPETLERIFGLFKRDVGREIRGSGAGLAIVREVAERHGGAAWARPRDGGGSEFIITFGAAVESKKEATG